MLLLFITIALALVFDYINGFHDAANAIATVVSTKVLTPRQAIALAACFNLGGALLGTAVASTVGKGLVDQNAVTIPTILAALLRAIDTTTPGGKPVFHIVGALAEFERDLIRQRTLGRAGRGSRSRTRR